MIFYDLENVWQQNNLFLILKHWSRKILANVQLFYKCSMYKNICELQIFAIFTMTLDLKIHVKREYFYANNFLKVMFSRFYRIMYISALYTFIHTILLKCYWVIVFCFPSYSSVKNHSVCVLCSDCIGKQNMIWSDFKTFMMQTMKQFLLDAFVLKNMYVHTGLTLAQIK
jgi:hypothetical protein